MEIKTGDYRIWVEDFVIHFEGTMRLSGAEAYQPIMDMLDGVVDAAPENITLDLVSLEFLNSSGINLLARFVIKVRKDISQTKILVKGTTRIPWQSKSLPNLERLNPQLELVGGLRTTSRRATRIADRSGRRASIGEIPHALAKGISRYQMRTRPKGS